MSLSMDDLCASLSSSHVGQEMADLAALQIQLAQTLFCQSMSTPTPPHNDDYAQPCNTPTGRTPSASISWSPMVDPSLQADLPPRRDQLFRDETEEDERMVEDLLMPTSPMSAAPQTFVAAKSQQELPTSPVPDIAPSLFTTTDPFYIAQLQAAQNYSAPPSVFAQAAFPSAQSPFMIHSALQRRNPIQPALSIDPHPLFVAAPSR